MSKLLVFLAHAMDARSIEDIIQDEQKYHNLLRSIGAIIINPFEQKRNVVQDGLSIAENDLALLKKSNLMLADLSLQNYQYVGCIFEIVYATINDLPVVMIVGERDFRNRMFFQAYCDFIAKTPFEAIDYISRVYTRTGLEKQMAEMKAYYNEIAPRYADKSIRTHLRSEESTKTFIAERKQLRRIIKKYVRGKVCQIGIGTGDWTRTICEFADTVCGVDQSQEMLLEARNNLSTYNNINFEKRDALEQHIIGGPFDCVVVYFLLSLLPNSMQTQLFIRVKKILKTGGLLVVADTKKFGDLPAIGLGTRQLQQRKIDNKVFTIYKEHFVGNSLLKLLERNHFRICESSRGLDWFSWAVSEKLG